MWQQILTDEYIQTKFIPFYFAKTNNDHLCHTVEVYTPKKGDTYIYIFYEEYFSYHSSKMERSKISVSIPFLISIKLQVTHMPLNMDIGPYVLSLSQWFAMIRHTYCMIHSAQETCVLCRKHGAKTAVCVWSRGVIARCTSVLNAYAFKGGLRK